MRLAFDNTLALILANELFVLLSLSLDKYLGLFNLFNLPLLLSCLVDYLYKH